MLRQRRVILPQTPIPMHIAMLNQFMAMVIPVNVDRRLTAKREPKPDNAEVRKALKKLFDFSITKSVMMNITTRQIIMILLYSGIVSFTVCSEYFSASVKFLSFCRFYKETLFRL